jgi:hypothetical protein
VTWLLLGYYTYYVASRRLCNKGHLVTKGNGLDEMLREINLSSLGALHHGLKINLPWTLPPEDSPEPIYLRIPATRSH